MRGKQKTKKRTAKPSFKKGGSKSRRDVHKPLKRREEHYKKEKPEIEEEVSDEFIIVGKNPVFEALNSDLQIERILVQKDNSDRTLKLLTDRAKEAGLIVISVDRSKLDSLADGRPHQGVAALMTPFPYTEFSDLMAELKNENEAILVIVDHLTDPHNFGAIIRSAEVCGAKGFIFPARRSACLSPAAVKASSGAAAYLPLVKVNNLSQVIKILKEKGFWIAGATMEGDPYYDCNLKGKIAIVLGNEGSGIAAKVKEQCDFLVSIPDYGKVDSMNVSNAAAVILAEAARQQH